MSKINKFTQAAEKERELLSRFFESIGCTNYSFTEAEGFDRYDATFEFLDIKYLVEVKVRNVKSNQYPTTLIDKSKTDFLREEALKEGYIPVLVIFFTDDKCFLCNLDKVRGKVERKYCNRTSAVNTGKKMKEVELFTITEKNLRDINVSKIV